MKISFVDGPLAGLLLEGGLALPGGRFEIECRTSKGEYCFTYAAKKRGKFYFVTSLPAYRPAKSISIHSIKQYANISAGTRTIELIGGKADGLELQRSTWKRVIRHRGLPYEFSHGRTQPYGGMRYFYRLKNNSEKQPKNALH